MQTVKIGAYSAGRVTELQFAPFAALEFFPAATPEMVAAASRALPGRITPDGKIVMSFHAFVLQTGRQAILVEDDFELDKGIALEPCHGHSPGHVVINVASGGKKGVFIGDVIHHPIQLLFPDLSTRADFDQNAARVSRRALIDKHADTG